MNLFERVKKLFSAQDIEPVSERRVVYVRGDELYTPNEYRSLLELEWRNLIAGGSGVSDASLTEIYKVTIPAYACIEYRSQLITEMPLMVADNNDRELKVHPFQYFFNSSPEVMENVERSLNIWGCAYLRKVYNANGFPAGLKWINNNDIEDIADHTGQIIGYWQILPEHERLDLDQIIYIGLFDPGSTGIPLSPLEVAFTRANIDRNLAAYAASFFFNNARPDGVLTFDDELTEEQLKFARDEWKAAFKGIGNQHRTAVMPAGARWTPVQTNMKDLALGELDDRTTQKVCAVFRVSPVLVGLGVAGDPLSAQSTLDAEQRQIIQRVVLPRANRICRALTNQWAKRDFVPKGYYTIKVDKQGIDLLSEVNRDKADTADVLVKSGIYDIDEARELMGSSARDLGDDDLYLKRNSEQPRQLFLDGLALFNESRKMIGLDPLSGGDFLLMGGDPIPKSKLREHVMDGFDKPKQEPPTPPPVIVGGQPALPPPALPQDGQPPDSPADSPPGDTPPEPPTDTPPPELPVRMDFRASSSGEAGATFLLDLGYDDLIASVRTLIRAQMESAPQVIRWIDDYQFHITLVHNLIMDTEQVRTVMGLLPATLDPLTIQVGGLTTFDQDKQIVLYLEVAADDRLRQFQRMLFELCTEVGATVSDLSAPESWIPHITLAYAQVGTVVPAFNQPVTVEPRGLLVTRGDYYEIGGVWMGTLDEPMWDSPNMLPSGDAPMMLSKRADMGLSLGVNLADNQFVRYARRNLADLLGELKDIEWVIDSEWRAELVSAEDWSPADAAKLMRGLDVTANTKIDAWTDGYALVDDRVYLKLAESEMVTRFADSLAMESEAFGIAARTAQLFGVLLAQGPRITADMLTRGDPQRYPMIFNNVALFVGEQSQTTWALRGVSKAQVKELKNWALVVGNKGRDYDFEPDALAGSPVTDFVRWGLKTAAKAENVFAYADAMLAGKSPVIALGVDAPLLDISIFSLLDVLDLPKDLPEMRTKTTFKSGLRNVFRGFWNGSYSMFEMLDAGKSVITRAYTQAWHEGAAREGIRPDELTDREIADLNIEIQRELANLLQVATDIQGATKADGGKLAPLLKRADNWTARYDRIAAKGELAAAGDKKKKWVFGNAEHCEDCAKLNGRVYRASTWRSNDIEPQSSRLQCFGIHCKCRFEDTDEPITKGKFPRLTGPRSGSRWDPHEHSHEEMERETT